MKKQIAMAVAIVLSAASGAWGQSQEAQQACTNDAFRFCGDVIPDRDRVFTCLVAKKNVISPACRTVISPYTASAPAQKAAVPTRSAEGGGVKAGKAAGARKTKTAKRAVSSKKVRAVKTVKSTKGSVKGSKTAKVRPPLALTPR
jgi:hypothetical protein